MVPFSLGALALLLLTNPVHAQNAIFLSQREVIIDPIPTLQEKCHQGLASACSGVEVTDARVSHIMRTQCAAQQVTGLMIPGCPPP